LYGRLRAPNLHRSSEIQLPGDVPYWIRVRAVRLHPGPVIQRRPVFRRPVQDDLLPHHAYLRQDTRCHQTPRISGAQL
jgi:hypothetical protein